MVPHTWGATLRRTFAGLTWRRFGVCLAVLMAIVLTKGPRFALASGQYAMVLPMLVQSTMLLFTKFAPVLLIVVAASNHGPREGWRRAVWLGGTVLVAQTIGTLFVALALPLAPPSLPIVMYMDPAAPPLVRLVRWVGLVLQDVGILGAAATCWFFMKRSADAADELHAERQQREEAERENAEARLSEMQAQIEPHFLFNTLASIRRLYETDRAAGRTMLRHLASYLSASLATLRAAHSTLGRELALALAYLNVQKIRMGPRLTVDVDVPPALRDLVIPPMMLATLVENAIIHGLSPLPEGGRVRIAARAARGRLAIEVRDTGRGLRDEWGPGVGLANIRARLRTEFGDRAELLLSEGPERGVTAVIELPMPAALEALAA